MVKKHGGAAKLGLWYANSGILKVRWRLSFRPASLYPCDLGAQLFHCSSGIGCCKAMPFMWKRSNFILLHWTFETIGKQPFSKFILIVNDSCIAFSRAYHIFGVLACDTASLPFKSVHLVWSFLGISIMFNFGLFKDIHCTDRCKNSFRSPCTVSEDNHTNSAPSMFSPVRQILRNPTLGLHIWAFYNLSGFASELS